MRREATIIFLGILLASIVFAGGCSNTSSPGASNTPGILHYADASLPAWKSGQPGSANISIEGGTKPYHCTLKQNSRLPPGFILTDDCTITGTAAVLTSGTLESISAPFIVIVTDSSNPSVSIEKEITIKTTEEFPQLIPVAGVCAIGVMCNAQVATAMGGTEPYHFQLGTMRNGITPWGTSVGVDGFMTGIPTRAGTYNFEICVVDVAGKSKCGMTSVTITDEEPAQPNETNNDESDNSEPDNTDSGDGTCCEDSDCSAFGNRHCGGSANARCGYDELCHCCLLFVSGANSQCLDCSACSGGTYCEGNTCVFNLGGLITD